MRQGTDMLKQGIANISESDAELWKLISDVPLTEVHWSYILGFINVILPGVGTMISSAFEEKWSKT